MENDEEVEDGAKESVRALALDGTRLRDALIVIVLVVLALLATTVIDASVTAGLLDAPDPASRPEVGSGLLRAKGLDAVIAIILALAIRRWLRLDYRALGLKFPSPGVMIVWSLGGLVAIYVTVFTSAIPIAIASPCNNASLL